MSEWSAQRYPDGRRLRVYYMSEREQYLLINDCAVELPVMARGYSVVYLR